MHSKYWRSYTVHTIVEAHCASTVHTVLLAQMLLCPQNIGLSSVPAFASCPVTTVVQTLILEK